MEPGRRDKQQTIMKRLLIIGLTLLLMVSCAYVPPTLPSPPVSQSRLWNTATYRTVTVDTPVTPPLIADLDVSPNKISFPLLPSQALLKTNNLDNIISSAVKEALKVNGNADVLIGMEYQIKYNDAGIIESVTVTGYPAKYVNFRHPDESIWLNENTFIHDVQNSSTKK